MNHKKQIYIMSFITLSFVCVFVAIFLFFNTSSAYTLSEDSYKIVAANINEFKAGTNFIYDDIGVTYEGASTNEYLDASPIYYEDGTLMIIPEVCIYVEPRNVVYSRIPSFSEVTLEGQTSIYGVYVSGGFIYDGVNTYTFLEDMTITINGVKVEVAKYSFITLSTNKVYVLYNTLDDTITCDTIYTSNMKAECNDYTVDVLNDILYTSSGDSILLFDDPELLDIIN